MRENPKREGNQPLRAKITSTRTRVPVRPSSITDCRPSLAIQTPYTIVRPYCHISECSKTRCTAPSLLILFPAPILPRNVQHVAYLPGAVAGKFCTEKEIKKGTSAGRLASNAKDGGRKGPCSNDRRQGPATAPWGSESCMART